MRWAGRPVTSLPVEEHPPRGRGHQPRHGAGQGALARPRSCPGRRAPTRRHGQRDPEERLGRAVADVEVLHLEDGLAHASAAPRRGGDPGRSRSVGLGPADHRARPARCRRGRRPARPDRCGSARGCRRRCAHRSPARRRCRTARARRRRRAPRAPRTGEGRPRSTICAEDGEQVLRRLDVQAGQGLVEEEDLGIAGQRTTHLDQAENPERQRGHRRLRHPREPEHLEQAVDAFVLGLRWREQRARVEHVPPEALPRHPGAVRQHEVLTHRQPLEELRLLERPGQSPASPAPAARHG